MNMKANLHLQPSKITMVRMMICLMDC